MDLKTFEVRAIFSDNVRHPRQPPSQAYSCMHLCLCMICLLKEATYQAAIYEDIGRARNDETIAHALATDGPEEHVGPLHRSRSRSRSRERGGQGWGGVRRGSRSSSPDLLVWGQRVLQSMSKEHVALGKKGLVA